MRPILLLILLAVLSTVSLSQTAEHPGVVLYKQGNYSEAARILSLALQDKYYKNDPRLWNYLSLSYIAINDLKSARKASQKAVKLDPSNSIYETNLSFVFFKSGQFAKAIGEASKATKLDPANLSALYIHGSSSLWLNKFNDAESDANRMMSLGPTDGRGYVLASDIQMARLQSKLQSDKNATIRDNIDLIRQARDVLTKGSQTAENGDLVANELESVDAFYRYFTREPRKPGDDPETGVTPFRITYKPKATYTDEARRENVQGFVRLVVLLGADGKVDGVLVLKRLGHGLDQQAIQAARKIKFEPKTKDGVPVSTVATLEYNFSIY
jgi:TonB family protein